MPKPRHTLGPAFWWLLATSLLVRLPGVGRPLLGHFSSKSILYAMIARNWARGDATCWQPRVDCLYAGERGMHFVDYPIISQIAAWGWQLCSGSLEVWGRATAVTFSVAAVALIYVLARRWHGPIAALAAGWMLALAPVSLIYGQSFMLESSLLAFTLATFYAFDRWLAGDGRRWLLAAAVAFSLLALSKIYLLVWIVPLTAMAIHTWRHPIEPSSMRTSRGTKSAIVAAGAFLLAALPALAWYGHGWWVSRADSPLAPHVFFSLHDSTRVHTFPHPALYSADFYRKLLDDLTGPALTPLGFGLALLGLLSPAARRYRVWMLTCGLLVVLLPLKFYKLNYYDLVILPPWALLAGLGWRQFQTAFQPSRRTVAALLAVGFVLSMRHAYFPAFVTPAEDLAVLPAAAALRSVAPPQEPIVAVHGSNFDLLYYCDHPGWAVPVDDPKFAAHLADATRQGAHWLVIANLAALNAQPAAKACLAKFSVETEGEDFRVYRLRP
ncbi:MAG TPA: phospholipid carrier-dependent glycosyltransferase [Pirellulales bacterium]|nr:phospholipid carrier-dependent glycosyltransferase [Pirellulales bacterium]